jgi:hypothetical protein
MTRTRKERDGQVYTNTSNRSKFVQVKIKRLKNMYHTQKPS